MTTVDASVVVEALIAETETGANARDLLASPAQLFAPHLVDVEVANALRRLVRAGRIESGMAATAVAQLGQLDIERLPHQPFLGRIWELRDGLSAYDASYVAVAEATGTTLVTTDAALHRSPGILCDVDVIGN